MIIYVAAVLSKMPRKIRDFKTVVKVLIRVAPIILVIAKSNLSTGIIVAAICILMMFGQPEIFAFFLPWPRGGGGWSRVYPHPSYRSARILAWLHPEDYPDDAYQTLQGCTHRFRRAVREGAGSQYPENGLCAEAQNDFIFTIICEELGLFGAICVILLFVLLLCVLW